MGKFEFVFKPDHGGQNTGHLARVADGVRVGSYVLYPSTLTGFRIDLDFDPGPSPARHIYGDLRIPPTKVACVSKDEKLYYVANGRDLLVHEVTDGMESVLTFDMDAIVALAVTRPEEGTPLQIRRPTWRQLPSMLGGGS